MSKRKKPEADHLQPETRAWVNSVAEQFILEEHHRKLSLAAGECWDRARQARDILAVDGLCVVDRFGQKRAHPMLGVERDMKILFARLLRELGLDVGSPAENRPPRLGGQKY